MPVSGKITCLILGGGGHARVVADSLRASGMVRLVGILDQDKALWGREVQGVPILGGDELLPKLAQKEATHFVVGLGGVGDNGPRRRLFELGIKHCLTPLTICHPSAICSRTALVGDRSVLFPGAIVNAGAIMGANIIVNSKECSNASRRIFNRERIKGFWF